MTQQSLITIGEASHILGVSEAALRRWTDEGQIKAFVTPGGHRRYSRVELKKFIASSQKVLSVKDLVIELEETVQRNRDIVRTNPSTAFWFSKLNRESQKLMGDLSRRFIGLIIRYINGSVERAETLKLADSVGHDYGATLAKLGLPLTDSVETFVRYREPVMNATVHLMKKGVPVSVRVVEAIILVDHVMDEALISLITAHQLHDDKSRDKSQRGADG